MLRRWKVYDQEMKALIAAGGVHQDADGWWVDDKTGELIGPDPDLERPLEEEELANMRPFREVFPDLAASMDREVAKRGRPPLDKVKTSVTIRLDPDIVAHYKATGKGWQSRMNDDLRKATGL
ncbi:BrnA antitoxin family protein [Neorhizobium petrolearium]|uniref:BrnA antitoxin family protein n=1 Tax=Neorhizobium petrolearium TaxID=515361 RepID=UPI003F5CE244